MIRYITLIFLFIANSSFSIDDQNVDDILWGYADFLEGVRNMDVESAKRYIEPDTKIGFGGDKGVSGFKDAVIDSPDCLDNLIFALRQGCKVYRDGQEIGCVSPPQFGDDTILYMGARVKFVKQDDKSLKIQYLICGGD